jgi:hypothetical protein
LTILEDVLYPDWGFYALPLRSVAIALVMVCLIQFSYRFPMPSIDPVSRRRVRDHVRSPVDAFNTLFWYPGCM